MVQPALGPSLGVAPWNRRTVFSSDKFILQVAKKTRAHWRRHGYLWDVQVQVGVDEEVVVRFLAHEEGPGEGVGDLGAFFHDVTELTCGGGTAVTSVSVCWYEAQTFLPLCNAAVAPDNSFKFHLTEVLHSDNKSERTSLKSLKNKTKVMMDRYVLLLESRISINF